MRITGGDKIKRFLRFILIFIMIVSILLSLLFFSDMAINSIEQVNIENYPKMIDYGILSQEQREIFDDILDAINSNKEVISCQNISPIERHEILTQLGLYYGSTEEIGFLTEWHEDKIILNLKLFYKLSEYKKVLDIRIDEAVSALFEGSDKYKLWQISNYISARIKYTEGYRDTIDALNGKGVCNTYAMLFYKMATRIGIKTYICYGYANDGYHAWNMVEVNNENRFYDITWYDDIAHNIRYIYNKTSWNRNFQINNKWSSDLEEKEN